MDISILETLEYDESLYSDPVFDLRVSPLTMTLIILDHLDDDTLKAAFIPINVAHHSLVQTIELHFLQSNELLYIPEQQLDSISL
jgi:hypothetical protein